jgi:solute carrier family 13 (sodium-dependent dicarboxylate transporter), member 2/3/5
MFHRIFPIIVVVVFNSILAYFYPENTKVGYGLSLAFWMLYWWISGAVSIGLTALLPLIYAPLLNIIPFGELSLRYANPVIFLFLGGFILALTLERFDVHRWIANRMLDLTGYSPRSKIRGILFTTAGMSMWISNTATALIMLPIAQQFSQNDEKMGKRALLSVAFGANIGGIATLVGTPPNLYLAAYLREQHHFEIDFATWLVIGLPIAIILLILTNLILSRSVSKSIELVIQPSKSILLTKDQKRVSLIFLLVAICWVSKPIFEKWLNFNLDDAVIALIGILVLAVIPAQDKKTTLLDGKTLLNVPWEIILLFGGGMSLALILQTTGAVDLLVSVFHGGEKSIFIHLGIATIIGVFATEILSNIALVAVMLPYIDALSGNDVSIFILLAIPLVIGASCAFMFPISTPPNAIVFGSGLLKVKDMIRVGWILNIASIVVISLSSIALLLVFGLFS